MRNCSSTWSVYDGEWDSHSQTHFAPLTRAFPLHSLKDCGVKKIELICRGAQGAVYKARDTRCDLADSRCCVNRIAPNASLLLECNEKIHEKNNCNSIEERQREQELQEKTQSKSEQMKIKNVNEVERSVCAVKRIFTQQNDFGRRGVADTVLREVTLLKHINRQQEKLLITEVHGNASMLSIKEPAKVVGLDRVVEAPHRELCMIMELCVLDLRRVFILHRSSQSMYSPNYNKTTSAVLETAYSNPFLTAQTYNRETNDLNVHESHDTAQQDVLIHEEKNTFNVNVISTTDYTTTNNNNNNNIISNNNNNNNNNNVHLEVVQERVYASEETGFCAQEDSSSLQELATPSTTSFPSELPLIRYLFRRICRVVYFLHKYCNVIHRDLKLSNILVTSEHELRLSDFGSARFIDAAAVADRQGNRKYLCREDNKETLCDKNPHNYANNKCKYPMNEKNNKCNCDLLTPSSMRTTLLYQSPESLLGEAIVPTALDVWSLGVILAELILQKHLFHANSELAMISAIWKLLGNSKSIPSAPPEPMPELLHEKQTHKPDVTYIHTLATSSDEEGKREAKETDDVNNVLDNTKEINCGTLSLKFPPSLLPECGLDLLRRMLCLDPFERINLEDVLQHPFLHFDGEDDDDKVGQEMWHGKINMMLQEEVSSRSVQMPMLNMTEEDESEGSESEVNHIDKLSYNYPYHCATSNDDGNNCSDDDSYELDLPQIHLHLSRKVEEKHFKGINFNGTNEPEK